MAARRRRWGAAAALAALAAAIPVQAQDGAGAANIFITLGTMGGPIGSAHRSQPANALVIGDAVHLVDVGDGAVQQLVRAGHPLARVRTVFVSHLHFDHVGGLAAVIGLRHQVNAPGVLTVYGPPGTRQLVDGILASMQPSSEAGFGVPGESRTPPEDTVRVVELDDGSTVELAGARVTAAANSHYSFTPGSVQAARYRSLSYRFDLPDRSIVYTGDTGPSAAVERLARGADLLVSEMIDLAATVALVRRTSPDLTGVAERNMVRHLSDHHLSPEQAGELAARAQVRRLVITHLVPGSTSVDDHARYLEAIRRSFRGEVAIASDLDRY